MKFNLPKSIVQFVDNAREVTRDEIGESPCEVYKIAAKNEVFFLKISGKIYSPTTFSVTREARVLAWLSGKISVPEIILHAENDECECMIARAVPGLPLYDFMSQPQLVSDAFCEAIRCLQQIPVDDCPFDSSAAYRLAEAQYIIDKNLVADDFGFDKSADFMTPADLLNYLKVNQVQENPVFSHGDLGDSNVFLDNQNNLYFIDLGRGGIADRWVDIAFAYRNLSEELSSDEAEALLKKLGLNDDPEKRRYFETLDELF